MGLVPEPEFQPWFDRWLSWWVEPLPLRGPTLVLAAALTLTITFRTWSSRWAALAIVLFASVSALSAGTDRFMGYVAAFLLGVAIVAGEPLPPPDPDDARLYAPIPRPRD